jgi:putative SOS response-associated peptidase YedK
MNWGFVLLQEGRAPKRVTNTRDDKIQTSFWKPSFEQRRCLVPASSYCEPNGETPCTWHWFALNGNDPRPLFAFAGIWRSWNGPIKKGGPKVEQNVFSFMTTLPNELTASINHERMPVLLGSEAEQEKWLKGTPAEAISLVRSFEADAMRVVQRGKEKEDLLTL